MSMFIQMDKAISGTYIFSKCLNEFVGQSQQQLILIFYDYHLIYLNFYYYFISKG